MGKRSDASKMRKVTRKAESKKIKKAEKEVALKAAKIAKRLEREEVNQPVIKEAAKIVINKSNKGKAENQKIAIIGGGLIGLSLAVTLARLGVKVVVFEKREVIVPTEGRVTNIYLSYRGITALNKIGVDPYKMEGWSLINGLTLHNAKGVTVPIPFPG